MNESVYRISSFIAIINKRGSDLIEFIPQRDSLTAGAFFSTKTSDCNMQIAFTLRDKSTFERNPQLKNIDSGTFILGDDYEYAETKGHDCMANAVYVEYDIHNKNLRFITSITGLPPLFVYDTTGLVIATSEIYLLTKIKGLRLFVDPEGIIEHARIGHPIDNRTFIKDLRMAQCGSEYIFHDGSTTVTKIWSLPRKEPIKGWDEFTRTQTALFKDALKKIDLSKSFLSLTAGLDTRAIFASLVQENISIPTYTLSGRVSTLDAKIANKLCKAYGFSHTIIPLDDCFTKNLPDYTIEASLLSGGIHSLDQATEVFFYRKIPQAFEARLSGNLGNQVGRRGSEGTSLRNVDISFFCNDLIEDSHNVEVEHWFSDALEPGGRLKLDFLVEKEVPYSSVGNYTIGNHFVTQQTPYANRELISFSNRMPTDDNPTQPTSLMQIRLKDLKHRFLGENISFSFQRRLINDAGGYVASCPINWGWRASRGVSLYGITIGFGAFLDAFVHSKGLDSEFLNTILRYTRIQGLHHFKDYRLWLRKFMKDFLYDTFTSQSVKEGCVFKPEKLKELLDDFYYKDRPNEHVLLTVLDIVLAQKNFRLYLS